MKKIIIASVLLGLTAIFMSACTKSYDIEDKNYVLVLGIDKTDIGYRFTYSLADLSGFKGEAGDKVGANVCTLEADSLEEAKTYYEDNHYKQLDYGHIKAIVYGRELLEDTESLYNISYQMWQDNSFAKTISVFGSITTAEELVGIDKDMDDSLGEYLRGMMENCDFTKCELSNVMDVYFKNENLVEMEMLKIRDDLPCRDYTGACIRVVK